MTQLGATVDEFGTRFVQTRVGDLGEGRFVWERRAGESRGHPLSGPSDAARAAVAAADAPGVRLVLPMAAGDMLRYALPGAFSAARLLRSADPAVADLVRAALAGTGAALRRLHAAAVPADVPRGPPAISRLSGWLAAPDGDLAPPARRRLGRGRWARAQDWCDGQPGPGGDVLLHGAPSLGLLVPSPQRAVAGLITGEDLARGRAELDLGWLLGELVELEHAARRGLGSAVPGDYAGFTAALLNGYGAEPAGAATRRVAALRVLTHAHDYAAYVGWHDDLLAYLDIVAELLDGG